MDKIKWIKKKKYLESGFFKITKWSCKSKPSHSYFELNNGTQYIGDFKKLSSAKTVANLLRNG